MDAGPRSLNHGSPNSETAMKRAWFRPKSVLLLSFLLLAWGAASWKLVPFTPRMTISPDDNFCSLWFSADGKMVVIAASTRETWGSFWGWWAIDERQYHHGPPLTVWNVEKGRKIGRFAEDWQQAGLVRLSSDGRYLAAVRVKDEQIKDGTMAMPCQKERTLTLWEVGSAEVRTELPGSWSDCRFTHNDLFLLLEEATHDTSAPARVRVWDLHAGQERGSVHGVIANVSLDGNAFATFDADYHPTRLNVWRLDVGVSSPRLVKTYSLPQGDHFALAPDLRTLAIPGTKIEGCLELYGERFNRSPNALRAFPLLKDRTNGAWRIR